MAPPAVSLACDLICHRCPKQTRVTSPDGRIDGVLHSWEQFAAEFTSAIVELLADWRMVVSALRKEYVYERA